MAPHAGPLLGASVRRTEDRRLLTGQGRYVADVRLDGALQAAVLRAAHAHAVIRGIDASAARSAPGVVTVLTAADLGEAPRAIPMRLSPVAALGRALQLPLAIDRVRYAGEPLAVVVAADRYQAEDALELIEVDLEPLPPVPNAEAALANGAAVLHEAVGSNLVAELETRVGDVEAALASADLVVEQRFSTQRHAAVPLETRGLAAAWDAAGQRLTVWGPTKVTHFNRRVLAGLLDLPEQQIRFVEPDVGGGFGGRGEFYPEDFLIPFLARRLDRPVAWVEDRSEHLRACNHSRQQQHIASLALRRDGTIVGLETTFVCDMGAYVRTHGATVPSLTMAMLPGPYRVPNYQATARCVLTNKTPTGTYRGPGRFEAGFVRERLLDLAAERLGIDPLELRRRNLVPPEAMPYDVGTGALATHTIYDSGDYPRLLDRALERFDLAAARRQQAEARAAGRAVGLGAGFFVEKSGLGPWEYARVALSADGRATLFSGCASVGQGMETALAQVVGQALELELGAVTVVHGDTDRVPRGGGAFASRGMVMAGSSAHLAAEAVGRRLRELAAGRLEAAMDDLELADGGVQVRGSPARRVPYSALVEQHGAPLVEEADFATDQMAYPYGLHLALVEVDAETGQLQILRYLVAYDVGRAVNPLLIDGQLVGGLAQGLGGALLEEFAYDDSAQPLATSFLDYLLPSATEVPPVEVLLTEDAPSPLNPLGVKGAGEGGTVAVAAALANAVADALRDHGVQPFELPLSPNRLRELLRDSSARQPPTCLSADLADATSG